MTRSNAREIAVHLAYELGFSSLTADELLARRMTPEAFALLGEEEPLYADFPNEKQKRYITELVRGVYSHGAELDGYIERFAVGRRFDRINRMAAAAMRVTMYEVLYMPEIPNAAAINEALEIVRRYEEEDVVRFVNGVLGAFVRAEFPGEG